MYTILKLLLFCANHHFTMSKSQSKINSYLVFPNFPVLLPSNDVTVPCIYPTVNQYYFSSLLTTSYFVFTFPIQVPTEHCIIDTLHIYLKLTQ